MGPEEPIHLIAVSNRTHGRIRIQVDSTSTTNLSESSPGGKIGDTEGYARAIRGCQIHVDAG